MRRRLAVLLAVVVFAFAASGCPHIPAHRWGEDPGLPNR